MNDKSVVLTGEEVRNAKRFQGYGNKNGKYWFLGMEEGGGSLEWTARAGHPRTRVEDQAKGSALQLGKLPLHEGSKVRRQDDVGQDGVASLLEAQDQLLADRFRLQGPAVPKASLHTPGRE